MRVNTLIALTIIILFSTFGVTAQKKAKPNAKKAVSKIKPAPKKVLFLDVNGREISRGAFGEKILLGEFGAKSFTTSNAENNQLVAIEEVILRDENNESISADVYRKKLSANRYNVEPILKENKIIGLKLKTYSLLDQIAPDYSALTLEEKVITAASQKGKITIINFWYIGCIPCMEEIPILNKVAEKYKNNSDITFLGVSIDSTVRLKEFLSKNRFDFQIVSDKSDMTKNFQANINGFPTTVIIDQNGKIVFGLNYLGEDAKFLESAINKEIQ